MKITLNGQTTEIPNSLDMTGLLKHLELDGKRLAVEVNECLVPRSQFDQHPLQDGDRVEIIHAVGGG